MRVSVNQRSRDTRQTKKKEYKSPLGVHDLWESPGKEEANCARAGYFISSVSAGPQYCIRRSNRAAFEGRQHGTETAAATGLPGLITMYNDNRICFDIGDTMSFDSAGAWRWNRARRGNATMQARQECPLKPFLFWRITRPRAASLFRYLTLLRWPLSSGAACRVEIRTAIEAWLRAMQIKRGFVY